MLVAKMTDWHTYTIDWQPDSATFLVDNQPVFLAGSSPQGPLGFVMWLDNQFMIITPWGKFGSGVLAVPEQQWLETSDVAIETSAN
jgi:beta-glucanase (GH16 family)